MDDWGIHHLLTRLLSIPFCGITHLPTKGEERKVSLCWRFSLSLPQSILHHKLSGEYGVFTTIGDWLWTVWTTLHVAHIVHSPGGGVGTFRLTKTQPRRRQGGLVFDHQMALFSIVKVQARYPKWPSFRSTNGLVFG